MTCTILVNMANADFITSRVSGMDDADYDKRLGQRLRTLREMHRMTQAEVGAQVGLSHQQIQKYEGGQSQIRVSLANRFARLFDIPVSQFLDVADMMAHEDKSYERPMPTSSSVAETAAGESVFIDNDIVKLVTLFSQISSPQQRAVVLNLAASLLQK